MTTKIPDRLWLCMSDSNRTRTLSRALAKGGGYTVYMGPTLDEEGPVGLVVCDDRNSPRLPDARRNAAPNQKVLLVTGGGARLPAADFYLDHDTDAGVLFNVIEGMRFLRDYEMTLAELQKVQLASVDSLVQAEFSVSTVEEARDLALMLAQICPQPAHVAVGLYVLLTNAIEHGNLEIDPAEKTQALAEGKWRRYLKTRQDDRQYAGREVRVKFQRGGRVLSLLIQDDGLGIDPEMAERADPTRNTYRGKGVKMARSLGFSQLRYLGVGNMIEATLLLKPPQTEDVRRSAAG